MTTTTTKPRIAEDAAPLMAPNVRVVKFSPARIRVFFNRLPFFTRTILLLNVVFAAASLIISWLPQSTALIPSEVGIWSGMRWVNHHHDCSMLITSPPMQPID